MRPTCFTAAFAIATALAIPAAAQTAAGSASAGASTTPAKPTAGTPVASTGAAARPTAAVAPPTVAGGITPPADYLIGVDDSLDVVYWQDKDMSATVVVRPDGNISLPLLNDVKAAGLTPEQLRVAIAAGATKFVEDPTVSVVVKAINSRKVFLTGQVGKPGPYPLMDATTTVLQMLATAGGPSEYAKTEKIAIVRRDNGKDHVYKFNYKNVAQGKSLEQNIVLKPGDTIIVP
jgi:polysaccharide export outer membrane protein